ncbi:MAG: DUF2889 domain-containing protein [Desulfurellaceae bacterium]|nr:DUF2889 domain-containing protein [Desulfurellaceae bacterium]
MTRPPYECALPFAEAGYTLTFEAEIDNLANSEIRVRGTLADHRCALAAGWIVRLPTYEIRRASATHLSGTPDILSSALTARLPALRGARVGQGFTRTIGETLGDLPGHTEHLTLATEMARVSLQAFPVPKDDHERFASSVTDMPPGPSRLARMLWERDRADFSTLKNSCFTYRDQSAQLFDERTIEPFDPDMAAPEPGEKRFFWRTKRLRITPHPHTGFHCQHAMDDPFQQMRIAFDIDAEGTIANATSRPGRLPFRGLCEEPHSRTAGLNGLKLGKDFTPPVADRIGGSTGCSHLFDLATDCLRLFTWRE